MPIDPESGFKSAISELKPVSTPLWTKDLASKIDGLVTMKAGLGVITGTCSFTFNKALFMSGLMPLAATPVAASAAQIIGQAWGNAMLVSTMVVAPGAFMGSPAPATLFSVIISSLIDPPSVMAAQTALIATLVAMQGVEKPNDSKIGPAIRTAFISCTATVTGLNSLPPPPAGPGPLPLTAPMCPFM